MPTFRQPEDLEVWRVSKDLSLEVYRITRKANVRRDYVFCDQIRKAALSVPLNIAEGLGRQTDRDFAHFVHIARGSAQEVRSLLAIGLELGYLDSAELKRTEASARQIVAQLSSLSQYLRGIPRRGR